MHDFEKMFLCSSMHSSLATVCPTLLPIGVQMLELRNGKADHQMCGFILTTILYLQLVDCVKVMPVYEN